MQYCYWWKRYNVNLNIKASGHLFFPRKKRQLFFSMPCTRLYLIYRPLLSSLRIFARRCFVVVTAFWRPLLPGTAQEVKVNDSQNSGMVGRRVKGVGVGGNGSDPHPPNKSIQSTLRLYNIFLGPPAPTMSVNWQSIFCPPPPILFWRRLILSPSPKNHVILAKSSTHQHNDWPLIP